MLTPFPSQVAPRGCGLPGHTRAPNSVAPLNALSECCIAGVGVSILLSEELSAIVAIFSQSRRVKSLGGKDQTCKRGQSQRQREWLIMTRYSFSNDATEISQAAAAICLRIGVNALPIIAAARYADAVIAPHHRREIANDNHKLFGILAEFGRMK